MTPALLDLLRDNPAGLTLAALRSACPDALATLPALVADGVVEPADLDGVAGYRLAAPKAPRPAPKRRAGLTAAEADALRKLLGLPEDADGAAIVAHVDGRTYLPRGATSGFIANASQLRRVQVIERWCAVSERIGKHLRHEYAHDCFCGVCEPANKNLASDAWRYDDAIFDFVGKALDAAIAPTPTLPPTLPDGWTVIAMERQTPNSTLRVWKSSARAAWGWAYGTDEGPSAPDMDKAIACVEAVAGVLGGVHRG